MKSTDEQQAITDCVCATPPNPLILVDSVAGSGKTTLLTAIAGALPHTNGLYLAYNKSVATESQRKFPATTHCMTTHSMAYRATVKPFKLKLGTFSHRDITERIKYDLKYEIISHIRSFCLSKHLSFGDYAAVNHLKTTTTVIANRYLSMMQSGKLECTHDFYLKFFHILLDKGSVTYDPFDFIMLDEAGDLNEVTLEIFKLLPSPRKIAVGDKYQNIYGFNDTINCFNVLANEGITLKMTQSFRVAPHIATKIETFCQKYLDPAMKFSGTKPSSTTIKTRGFLTRTNGALINKMILLNAQNIPYGLVRKASDIFKVPLMLCSLKYQGFITDPSYKHLQSDIDEWHDDPDLRSKFTTVLSYLSTLYPEDVQLIQAIRLLQRHKRAVVLDTYEEARKHEKGNYDYTLATVHSCKGAEFDEVTIADDLNESIADIYDSVSTGRSITTLSPQEVESLNLYYVATTRAAKELFNARYL